MKLGKVKILSFFLSGDPVVSKAVRGLSRKRSAIMRVNCGSVTAGKDVEAACNAGEELKETPRLAFLLLSVGTLAPTNEWARSLLTKCDMERDE